MEAQQNSKKCNPLKIALNTVVWLICVVLVLMLACNITIIVKGNINPETPPDIFGVVPMVVLTDSMSGDAEDHIEAGDLIFIKQVDPDTLKVNDVICFMEGDSTVTHRIIGTEIYDGSQKKLKGQTVFVTKGDFNNAEDAPRVAKDVIVGKYTGVRIGNVGRFVLFLQRPVGMAIFIGVPVICYIVYDIVRRKIAAKKQDSKEAELNAELERLRTLAGEENSEQTEE